VLREASLLSNTLSMGQQNHKKDTARGISITNASQGRDQQLDYGTKMSLLAKSRLESERTNCQPTDASPNEFLNLLGQRLVHRLKVDRGLPEENQ